MTGRATDLRSGIAGVALDLLAALRAGEFEFRHKFDRGKPGLAGYFCCE
jgi:hypothetical protein